MANVQPLRARVHLTSMNIFWKFSKKRVCCFVMCQVPFCSRSYWELVGVGPRGVLGLRVWGQGLTIYYLMADGDGWRGAVPGHEVRQPDAAADQPHPDWPGCGDRPADQAVHHNRWVMVNVKFSYSEDWNVKHFLLYIYSCFFAAKMWNTSFRTSRAASLQLKVTEL